MRHTYLNLSAIAKGKIAKDQWIQIVDKDYQKLVCWGGPNSYTESFGFNSIFRKHENKSYFKLGKNYKIVDFYKKKRFKYVITLKAQCEEYCTYIIDLRKLSFVPVNFSDEADLIYTMGFRDG